MFRRTSSCHQDFTPPPSPPRGREGDRCRPVVAFGPQLPLPTPTRAPASSRRRRRRERIAPLLRLQEPRGLFGFSRPSSLLAPSSSRGGKRILYAFFAGFLTQQIALYC